MPRDEKRSRLDCFATGAKACGASLPWRKVAPKRVTQRRYVIHHDGNGTAGSAIRDAERTLSTLRSVVERTSRGVLPLDRASASSALILTNA
ncbi:hypothetical protein KPL78_16565 [Roseomonas sp. HJA6]|uniref:Uncharacterized protein n=1 Tax=Roseomonas alba TaxID=2846776 RepID=A0ABS7ABC2_9PROT|nr:hypothetical protein [Neoroseomonas alba]